MLESSSQSKLQQEIKDSSVYDHLRLGLLANHLEFKLTDPEIPNTKKLVFNLALHQINQIQDHLANDLLTEKEIDEFLNDWTKLDEILNI